MLIDRNLEDIASTDVLLGTDFQYRLNGRQVFREEGRYLGLLRLQRDGPMGSPLNSTVEVGGPERFRLDELVRRALAAWNDPREVVTDPHARYYGIAVSERTLVG